MTHTFLLEIGLEEIPAHVVTPSVNQLATKTAAFLKEQRLAFAEIKTYSTPRRLAVEVVGLADKQDDIEEEAKGPSKKIALDADGNWTKAAQGFARGQKLTVDDLFFKELKGTEYVYAKKFIPGKAAAEVLQGMKDVAMSLKFPTMMRWGSNDFEYVRPIKWLVALLDDEVVPFNILDIATGRTSQGHRFLGHPVMIDNPAAYVEALRQEKVIVDAQERKTVIVQQIEKLAQANNWKIVVEDDLLEEVNNLVEWPTVFAGSFKEQYLQIPDEVLITSMRDHQRFFYVTDQNGNLLPNFVSVRNGNTDHLENVIAGNEKVLTARLEDAAFFYAEDQKHDIAYYVGRLQDVMFHDKIGSIAQKMERVRLIAGYLGKKLGLMESELTALDRAAQIYKFDLVTEMVGEFSELQGVMGEIYAKLMGEDSQVATAIREQYMPISAEGELPQTKVGAILSIADKIDSIQAFFAAGMIPSGSNDPYALRRQATGIVRIALANNWEVSGPLLEEAIQEAHAQRADLYTKIQPEAKVATAVRSFLFDRLHQILADTTDYRRDILMAVLANKSNSFVHVDQAAQVLMAHKDDTDFKDTVEALTRVTRLASKAGSKDGMSTKIDPTLFENESERVLADRYEHVATGYATESLAAQFDALHSLKDAINAYFDETMIMVDDVAVKQNRLAQLVQIAALTASFGSLEEVQVK